MQTVSIIGCGWLGLPLALQFLAEGYNVRGSTTSPDKLPELRQKGIDAHLLRLNPKPTTDLATLLEADTLIVNIPPKASKLGDDFHPDQIQYVAQAIHQSSVRHIVYVSSTSVYPELNRVVTEADVTSVAQSAAPGLVRAEQLILALASDLSNQRELKRDRRLVTILRCGGLMGYDRIPGKYVAGRTVDSGTVPVNYLHRDDAVGIIQTLVQQQLSGVFNAVAPKHPTREAIYRKSCADFGYDMPVFINPSGLVPYKIVSPDKLSQATNYPFHYPNPIQFFYKSGLP